MVHNKEKINLLLEELKLKSSDSLFNSQQTTCFGSRFDEKLSELLISEQQKEVLTHFFDNYKGLYVTGSLSLLINKIELDREIKDVDLFTSNKSTFDKIQTNFANEILEYSNLKGFEKVLEEEASELPESSKLDHITFFTNKVLVDVFYGTQLNTIFYDKIINDITNKNSLYPYFIDVMSPIHSYDMKYSFISDNFHNALKNPFKKEALPEYIRKHIDDLIKFLTSIKKELL